MGNFIIEQPRLNLHIRRRAASSESENCTENFLIKTQAKSVFVPIEILAQNSRQKPVIIVIENVKSIISPVNIVIWSLLNNWCRCSYMCTLNRYRLQIQIEWLIWQMGFIKRERIAFEISNIAANRICLEYKLELWRICDRKAWGIESYIKAS